MAFDTPFPPTTDQVAKQDEDLQTVADAPVAPAPASPTISPLGVLGVMGSLIGPAMDAAKGKDITDDRSFKGFGNIDAYPTATDVQNLRTHQHLPDAIDAFNMLKGADSANRYLNYPPKGDVENFLKNKDDKQVVELFDRTYGDISKPIAVLYNPKSSEADRMLAAFKLNGIYRNGKSGMDYVGESIVGEAAGAVKHGIDAAGTELQRTAASGIDAIAGTDLSASVGSSEDTRLLDHPIVSGLISGLTQFITGQAIIGGATGGLGMAGTASKLVAGIRSVSLMGLTGALGFNPDDPLLGNMAKYLGMGDNWFTKYDNIDQFHSEVTKRLAHGVENAGVGLLFEGVFGLYRAARAAKAGDVAGGEALKTESTEKIEKALDQQLELPLGEDPNVQPGFNNKGLMDLPLERRVDKLPESVTGVPAESMQEMETRLHDKWGQPHQLKLDLGEPVGEAFTHDHTPGAQGDLFGTNPAPREAVVPPPPEPSVGSGVPAIAAPAPTPPKGKWTYQAFAHPVTPENPVPPPKSYSVGEIKATSQEQFIKDRIEDNPPLVREAKANIEGPPKPPVELPDSIRAILDRIPDFTKFTLANIRATISPLLNDFLKVTERTPFQLEEVMVSQMHPADVQKIQALTAVALEKARGEAVLAGSELAAMKKANITDAGKLTDLVAKLKDAQDLVASLQKLDYPLGTFSGRLLQQRQIIDRIVQMRRVDVNALRAAGVSEERINGMLRYAMDKADNSRLSELTNERKLAVEAGVEKRVADIDFLINKEMKRVGDAGAADVQSMTSKIVGDVASYTISSILSGAGTVIKNVLGILLHIPLQRTYQLVGSVLDHGPVAGVREFRIQQLARHMAMRSANESLLTTLSNVITDGAKSSFANKSLTQVKGMADSYAKHRISGDKYGLTGTGKTLLDGFGKGVDMLTLPLRFSDEVASELLGKHAIGTHAGFDFADATRSHVDLLNAKLRDPTLTATARAGLENDLKLTKGNNPTIEIGGEKTTLKDYVTKRVNAGYDDAGKLVDPKAVDDVNYTLLRRRQTTALAGKAIEELMNSSPFWRFIVPVYNTPMNGLKHGFEMIPGLNLVTSDLMSELKSADPFTRSQAHGKLAVSFAATSSALALAEQGFITVEEVTKRDGRLADQASSSPGAYQLMVYGHPFELSGLEPVSVVMIWAASFMKTYKDYTAALEQRVDAQNSAPGGVPIAVLEQRLEKMKYLGFAAAGASASAIMSNPLMGGLKDIMDVVVNLNKLGSDDGAFDKEANTLARGQIGKLVPTMLKQFAGFFDNKRYDPASMKDIILSTAGITGNLPMRYDTLGFPIVNKAPLKSLLGPIAPVTPNDPNSKQQYVIDTLKAYGDVTGTYHTFSTTPPDGDAKQAKVDMRTMDSVVGPRKVEDEYAKNFREYQINGRTLTEVLYNIITDGVSKKYSVGNMVVNGTKLDTEIKSAIKTYQTAAWNLTLAKESDVHAKNYNIDLKNKLSTFNAMKWSAQRSDHDQLFPTVVKRTGEMLPLFPQR